MGQSASGGNQMFTRFSNIQLQNSMNKNGKISGQGGRAFQSVNNFFNPRTAGAQKHPNRERISSHHFQGGDSSQTPNGHSSHHHPMSPGGGVQGSHSRINGSQAQEGQYGGTGSIFLKNTFSPRMKIGQPPGSSGAASGGAGSSGAASHGHPQASYQGGGLGGPIKAAHHNRPGMGGQPRASGSGGVNSAGGLEDARSAQSPNHSFNAQGTSLHHGSQGGSGGSELDTSLQRSPNRGGKGAAHRSHQGHSSSPTAGVLASSAGGAASGAAHAGSRSRPRPAR